MTRKISILLTAVLLATFGTRGAAQNAQTMQVRPDSKVTLAGSSNVHGWACSTSSLNATIALDSAYDSVPFTAIAKPIAKVVVGIPVRSLKCGHGAMDDNMYKALKADQFPDITYVLGTYQVDTARTSADTFSALTRGALTVAGRTVQVEIPITARRATAGGMTGEGTVRLTMTEFGIKPPTAIWGTLRTKNEITVSFTVLLDKSAVVALRQR